MGAGRPKATLHCRECSRVLTINHPKVSEGAYWYCADCWYHREKERERVHRDVRPIRSGD